jgi:hypothetical protein
MNGEEQQYYTDEDRTDVLAQIREARRVQPRIFQPDWDYLADYWSQ